MAQRGIFRVWEKTEREREIGGREEGSGEEIGRKKGRERDRQRDKMQIWKHRERR